ncbi:MAG: hypothetical protein AAFN63_13605 [Pseudomonadota bacterium]
MKSLLPITLIMTTLLACAPERPPLPALPEGVETTQFNFVDDSYLRGVQGSYNTTPAGRPAAILDVTYDMTCIADGAQSRKTQAERILDEKYIVAPLFFANPRERGAWRRDATNLVKDTGCIINGVSYERRTTDRLQTAMWALQNGVPPVR